jgi:tyrosine phenol-lyase
MLSEPFKLKDVKNLPVLQPAERVAALLDAGYNTFRLGSNRVIFDLVARGTSAWSHFQKAGLEVGDEAYAGAANFYSLTRAAREVLGVEGIVPSHNGIGAEKLLVTTMMRKGQAVLHNRGRCDGLVQACGGESIELGVPRDCARGPDGFNGNFDLPRLEAALKRLGNERVAFVYMETCPDGRLGQPFGPGNIREVRRLTKEAGVPLAVDISNVLVNAWWICKARETGRPLLDVVREIVSLADVVLMDAGQDARCDIGGFIASTNPAFFEKFLNQVVVFEGLHTYGGMSGRAMEVFAVGTAEMARLEYVEWHQRQVESLQRQAEAAGVPIIRTPKGLALEVSRFLPHVPADQHPKFALAACLYLQAGIRGRIDGPWDLHTKGEAASTLLLELPRLALNRNHLTLIAGALADVWKARDTIRGLRLLNTPEFVDEAVLEPFEDRLMLPPGASRAEEARPYEPYRAAVFEPIKPTDKAARKAAMAEAGYNTFLLKSEDIYIDFLTDSGTAAMSTWQWEGMADADETPYSSVSYAKFEETFRELLGYKYVIPTHQGRAAEHIMSQVMIRSGQSVPGNMYFTTTKLHQEMAGGVFVDVIVDEAHDSTSEFPWKGNIDIGKLEAEIQRVGADNVAYISFEMSVNMAGGQPFSMQNAREVSALCHKHGIPVMYDATRCVENAEMIRRKDPAYAGWRVRDILKEMLSYGDGCTVSCKKDFLVNMGGLLACNNADLAKRFQRMLRVWEGDVTNGGLCSRDLVALYRGLLESLDDDYIRMRIEQTQEFGRKLMQAGVPIVVPPGSHAIFIDARRFLPHVEQEQYTAQALASAIYIETGVRTMERGNVSKGRDPKTGQNYRPKLELVRCTIPRRVYTPSHFDYIVEGIARLYRHREEISGLKFVYEPPVLRFFQGRFEPLKPWAF